MLRLTRKAFLNLAIWMIGFGVLIGLVFPPFATLFGVPAQKAYSVIFIASCLTAGVLVGLVNFGLTKLTVGRPLWRLVKGMRNVQERLLEHHDGPPICTMATCAVPVESEDALGEGARSFNRMLDVLSASMHSELALRSFSEVLARHLDTNTLTTKALELLLEHSDAQGGAILVERQGNLEICASHGLTSETSLSDNEHVQRAFAKGIGQRIEIPETVKVEALLSIFRPREILVEPIVQGAATLGVLVLAKGNPFEEDAKGRLELMRRALALALNNALMVERLQRIAALDPLTSVYNRRFGLRRLHEELGRAIRAKSPLTVLMFDIDHFKSVNDTYGHLVGDRVLRHIAKSARATCREGDILIRYGGEEFLLVAPAASLENAKILAERLRRSCEEMTVVEGNQQIKVTVSVGVAAYPDVDVDEVELLIKAADDALYRAKDSGRNRVILAKVEAAQTQHRAPQTQRRSA